MGTPFLGEIKIISWNFAPKGWALCNGQFLPINQNQALFSLLGTMYGGNGQTTFALPNFRGRVPVHVGSGFTQGEAAGSSAVTINLQTMPAHNHFVTATNNVSANSNPTGTDILGKSVAQSYGGFSNAVAMNAGMIPSVGGSQPHENRQPYLVLNFVIALIGVFPSRN